MDLLYLGYYLALFLIPFVGYFLLYKENDEHIHTSRDLYFFIKLFYAKKSVKKYKNKYKSKVREVDADENINILGEKHSNSHYFYGLDQNGNNISLKFILKYDKIAEVSLVLRLADGNSYTFPGEKQIVQMNVPKEQWKINGLKIEILEPFKRLRVTFNGLLRNVAVKEYEKVEHVQFNLIFNASGSPTHMPHDMDTNLLAEALTRERWRDGSWQKYLVDQSGYEQFGAMQGFVKGDSYPKEYILNLPTCRSKHEGICDSYMVKRGLRIFIADVYGNLINIVVKSFKNGISQLNYGSVILSNNTILPIKGVDIVLKMVADHKNIPQMITTHIEVHQKLFKCVIHLKTSNILVSINNGEEGYECYNVPAECNVNSNEAKAIAEFWYSKKGTAKFVPNTLLCENTGSPLPATLISDLKNEQSKVLGLTGGKGSSLALLSSLNSTEFLVPDGFVLTVNAFHRQLESSSILSEHVILLSDICRGKKDKNLEETCEETVRCFKKLPILTDIKEEILSKLDAKKDPKTIGWAVRSSALGEDSEAFSAAGQNETILGCTSPPLILEAIQTCWASLFTYQSVQYRRQHGLPVVTDMAVVIQKMIPSDSAGVLFTCHPSNSNPSQMVITSNYGLGESVVSGRSDPDSFILNRTWDDKVCLLASNRGGKNLIIRMTTEGGTEEIRNEEAKNESYSLTPNQIDKLGRVGVLLEKAFGGPRDIEWAFYEDQLYLLQCRPITTLNYWSDFELTHELDSPILTQSMVLTVANIGEVIPDAMTVLSQTSTLSILDKATQYHFTKRFDPFASISIKTSQHTAMIDVINWIHRNISKDVKISSHILDLAIFGHPVLDEKLNHIAISTRGVSPLTHMLRANISLLFDALRNSRTYHEMKRNIFNFDITIEDSLTVIYKKIEIYSNKIIPILTAHCRTSSVSVFFQVVAMNILLEGSTKLTEEHHVDFAFILSSCNDVISVEIPKYLAKIAKMIRDEGYNEQFCAINPEFGVSWLKNKCPEVHKLFEEFLKKHGHRNLGEFEVMEESWAENPSKIISMIQANANCERINNKIDKSVDEIIKNLVSPKKALTRILIKILMNLIQSSVRIRESSKSEIVRVLNMLRLSYRLLAKKMVSDGFLPSQDLIYHLTYYEIGQVLQNSNPVLITKAIRRQKLYPNWRKQKFPELMYGVPIPENDEEVDIHPVDKICSGTPVCIGAVKARACVIKSLDDIDQLQTGDILITHCTDIGWSPYFPKLSGIATELGGLISHGAVVAREYGLPCLVGVKNATKVFKTGDIVVLSGNTGKLGIAE